MIFLEIGKENKIDPLVVVARNVLIHFIFF